jgi:hypothetical protein
VKSGVSQQRTHVTGPGVQEEDGPLGDDLAFVGDVPYRCAGEC